MTNRQNSYVTYSLGCAVVWGVILSGAAVFAPKATFEKILTVCSGWWMGWTSATIARWVYPPPKRRHAETPSPAR
jgi:hypothetical protein